MFKTFRQKLKDVIISGNAEELFYVSLSFKLALVHGECFQRHNLNK
jgi:hypothetical protein